MRRAGATYDLKQFLQGISGKKLMKGGFTTRDKETGKMRKMTPKETSDTFQLKLIYDRVETKADRADEEEEDDDGDQVDDGDDVENPF